MSDVNIKVLGPGCKNCETLHETVKKAVAEMGIEAEIDYVKDMGAIAKYVMMTPGLVINEKVAHQGKPLPNVEKVKALINKATGK